MSLIDWKGMDAQDWLNLGKWKDKTKFKDSFKYWKSLERIQRLKEPVGRVLDCFGDCRLYRDSSEHRIQHMSEIMEADEILTSSNSYLWVFLYDGTIVRLSPSSSVTIKEINITDTKIFLHARLNIGNILWLSRHMQKFEKQKMRETDTIFFPMAIHEANPLTRDGNISMEDYLFGDEDVITDQYTRVNNFIDENNKFVSKPTEALLVMPGATVFGENISMEAYLSIARENFFKLRTDNALLLSEEKEHSAVVNLRGHVNKEMTDLSYGSWYKVAMPARKIEQVEPDGMMNINELITKRIPSIYYSREAMLKKYSQFLFDKKMSRELLAVKYGYRKWTNKEVELRKKFLWDFSRRLETSNIAVAERYRDDILKKYNIVEKPVVNNDFFKLALAKYLERGEVDRERFYNPKLNSEKKELWKRLHGIRSKAKASARIRESAQEGTSRLDESSLKN